MLAQLAALPADQRAALARLLAPPGQGDAPAPVLDDRLPESLERTAERLGRAKGDAR